MRKKAASELMGVVSTLITNTERDLLLLQQHFSSISNYEITHNMAIMCGLINKVRTQFIKSRHNWVQDLVTKV